MNDLVTFTVGDSRYAIPADVVVEIVETGPITHHLPGAEERAVGLARVRDRWIPVVELAHALHGAPRLDPDADEIVLLVLGRDRDRLGLRVQDPGEVVAAKARVARGGEKQELLDLDGELVRYIDPAVLVASGAQLLAEKGESMDENRAAAEPIRVVTFQLGGEEFGLDVMRVFEVLPVPELRPVPNSPEFVEGVVEMRDSIVPVIDMRKRFSLPPRDGDIPARLLVVALDDDRVGLIVDNVPGVVPFPEDAVSPPPDFFKGLAGRYLEGLIKHDERLVILLNVGEILSSKERIALGKVMKKATAEAGDAPKSSRAKGKKRDGRRKKKADS